MSEVTIPAPVKARWVTDEKEFFGEDMTTSEPGLLMFEPDSWIDQGVARRVLYSCPCGCGTMGAVLVGENEKPAVSPSWMWTGGFDNTTLQPSVHHIGHWHGWLRDGYWVQA